MKTKALSFTLTLLICLTVLTSAVAASTITGAEYKGKITVRNTSYSTSAYVPFTMNTDTMINGGYLDSDFSNVTILGPDGSDARFMPARSGNSTWLMWLPTVAQNSVTPYYIYTGGSTPMEGDIAYFPNTGGMSVNDSASLELGDDFEIEISGYFDTSAGAGKNPVDKDGAVEAAVSGASEITTTVNTGGNNSYFSSTSDGQIVASNATYSTAQAATTGTATSNGTTIKIGQEFSATTQSQTNNNTYESIPRSDYSGAYLAMRSQNVFTGNITQFKVLLLKSGSPTGTISVDVYSGGTFKGTMGTLNAATLTTSPVWYTFSTPVNVTSSDYLYIRLSYSGDGYSGSNYVYWRANSTGSNSWLSDYIWYHSVEEGDGQYGREPAMEITYDPIYTVDRSFLFFDTSAIPDTATITSATIGLYGASDQSVTDFNLTVTNGQSTYPHDPLQSGDFNKTNYSGSGGTLSTSGFSTSGYNTITLDATGRSWINLTGTTKLGIFSSRDIAVTTPTGNEYVSVYATDQTGTDKDPVLTITYTIPAVSSVATGVTSGAHIYKFGLSGGSLTTKIDGVTKDTDAVTGSVINNSNNWTFATNSCLRYIDYIKITVNGTLKGHWAWQGAATFTDLSGNGNTATPTFITSGSSGSVTATVDSFGALVPSTYSGVSGSSGSVITGDDLPVLPDSWYSSLHADLPGDDFLEAMNIPPSWFWLNVAFALIILAMFLMFWLTKDLMAMDIAGGTTAAAFTIWIGLSLWIFVPFMAVWVGELVRRRVVSL